MVLAMGIMVFFALAPVLYFIDRFKIAKTNPFDAIMISLLIMGGYSLYAMIHDYLRG